MMKTMLIPVDFTATSDNAISYAVEWAHAYDYKRIILLKTLYDSVFENLISSSDYMHVNQDYRQNEREEAEEKMKDLCNNLTTKLEPGIKVSSAISDSPLLRFILNIVEDEAVELIVLGSDNYDYSSDSFIGGNVINIAKASPVRLIIVPSQYQYKPVRQALVPVNFTAIDTLNKLHSYQANSPLWKDKKLLVLNVDPKEKYKQPDQKFEATINALHEYLKNFTHEIYYSNNKNIIQGILEFSKNNDVQLIIALPGKYSFLYSLLYNSISEAIYRNAKEPVLILK